MGHRSTVKFTHCETCKLLWIFTLFLKNLVYKSYLQDPNQTRAKRGVSPHLNIWPGDLDLWLWKSIGFQILLRTKYVPNLVKIHWRMLILECSQGCYAVKFWPGYLDIWPMRLWPWKSIGFQIILRTKYVPSFVKNPLKDADSRVFTRMLCSKNLSLWPWSLTYNLENQ
jgi:hypothetical protein